MPVGEMTVSPDHSPTSSGNEVRTPPLPGRRRAAHPAPLAPSTPKSRRSAPALMRSIKSIIDVEVRCEVLAGGKRSSAADTGALICTTWLKPESRHFINGFSLC